MSWGPPEEPAEPWLLAPADIAKVSLLEVKPSGDEAGVWRAAFGGAFARWWSPAHSTDQIQAHARNSARIADHAVAELRRLSK